MKGQIYHRGECDYGNLDAVNFSTLKAMARSPKHYRHWLREPKPATRPMELGVAAHVAVLEPERFLREFVLWDRKSKTGKMAPRTGQYWEAFLKSHPGKKVITTSDYDQAIAFKDAIRSDETAMSYLGFGRPEVSMAWVDSATGMKLKGRVDWVGKADGGPVIVDVKTTKNASPWSFGAQCARLSYHLQLAVYHDGYAAATGREPRVVVVVVETEAPHDVVTYIAPPEVLEIGRERYRDLLATLSDCRAADYWPGQGAGKEQILRLPAWIASEAEEEVNIEWDK